MRKSCSNSSPSIVPLRQHPHQLYIIFLLLRKGDHFPIPLIIHITPPLCSPLQVHQHTRRYPLCGPSIHHNGSYPRSVLPITPAVVLCVTPPSTTPAIVICRTFHSTNWFSRPNVLDQHYTGAPNLKGVFSLCVLRQVPTGELFKSLVVGSVHGKLVFIHHRP